MPKYWIVGAMWGDQDDQSETFIRRGYWFLGWSDAEQPTQTALRDQIQPGDRIAIKRMLGQGSPSIEIRALGVVKEIDPEDKRVYVHWAASGLALYFGLAKLLFINWTIIVNRAVNFYLFYYAPIGL